MKGIAFAGCSYTWGQGLYYYSDLNHIPYFEKWQHDYSLMKDASLRFKDTLAFPRLVANHFNTFEVMRITNGGSDSNSLWFLKKLFLKYEPEKWENSDFISGLEWLITENFYYDDFDYVVFQFTVPSRTAFPFTYKGVNYAVNLGGEGGYFHNVTLNDRQDIGIENGIDNILLPWLQEKNMTVNQFFKFQIDYVHNLVKEYLMLLESKGIKTKVILWKNENLSSIYDEFFMDRLVKLRYEEKSYLTLEHLMEVDRTKFVIAYDKHGFNGKIPEKALNDYHPSKLCHRVIADSIIYEIEKDINEKR